MDEFKVPEREKGEVRAAWVIRRARSARAPSPEPPTGADGVTRRNPDSELNSESRFDRGPGVSDATGQATLAALSLHALSDTQQRDGNVEAKRSLRSGGVVGLN
jgi:hypothetical protein